MPRLLAGCSVGVLLALGVDTSTASTAAAAGCTAGADSDFNGDGVRDLAIADPEATVSGHAEAGLVRIVYGGGKGLAEIHQDSAGVPGAPEPGDRFGHSLAAVDYNKDGCTDLVVGIPYEDIGETPDSGLVQVLYGATTGLATGTAVTELLQGSGSGSLAASEPENQDWLGFAVAGGRTSAGEPYLAIGVPGEDLGTTADAGMAHYLRGTANVSIHQDHDGVQGVAEADDRFGYSLAATPKHLGPGPLRRCRPAPAPAAAPPRWTCGWARVV